MDRPNPKVTFTLDHAEIDVIRRSLSQFIAGVPGDLPTRENYREFAIASGLFQRFSGIASDREETTNA